MEGFLSFYGEYENIRTPPGLASLVHPLINAGGEGAVLSNP